MERIWKKDNLLLCTNGEVFKYVGKIKKTPEYMTDVIVVKNSRDEKKYIEKKWIDSELTEKPIELYVNYVDGNEDEIYFFKTIQEAKNKIALKLENEKFYVQVFDMQAFVRIINHFDTKNTLCLEYDGSWTEEEHV